MTNEVKAVVFDIDGTITPNVNSWIQTTIDLGASVEEHKRIFFEGFRGGTVSYDQVRERLTKEWQSTGKATRKNLERIFTSWPVYGESYSLISFLKKKGLAVVFIGGGTSMYVKIIAEKFGVSDFYANGELVFSSQGDLIDFYFPLDESRRKLEHLLTFCEKKSISPENVVALGDGKNDIEIFKATKKGIAVGPKKPKELTEVAWKELDTLADAQKFFEEYIK